VQIAVRHGLSLPPQFGSANALIECESLLHKESKPLEETRSVKKLMKRPEPDVEELREELSILSPDRMLLPGHTGLAGGDADQIRDRQIAVFSQLARFSYPGSPTLGIPAQQLMLPLFGSTQSATRCSRPN
jgi:hypothetical protein